MRVAVLMLSLGGCSSSSVLESDYERTLAAVLTMDGDLKELHFVDGHADLELEEGYVVLFGLDSNLFMTPEGSAPTHFREVQAVHKDAPVTDAESCGRCLAPRTDDPMLVYPGDRCPLPGATPATVYSVEDATVAPTTSPTILEKLRADLRLDWPGTCAGKPATLIENPRADPFRVCQLHPDTGPTQTLAVSGSGWVAAGSPDSVLIVDPAGAQRKVRPGPTPLVAGFLDETTVLLTVGTVLQNATAMSLDVVTGETTDLPWDIEALEAVVIRSESYAMVSARDVGRRLLFECQKGDAWECSRLSLPTPNQPGCNFLIGADQITELTSLGDDIVGSTRFGSLLVRKPGGDWQCLPTTPAREGATELALDSLFHLSAVDGRVVACFASATDTASKGLRSAIVARTLEPTSSWSSLLRLEPGEACMGFIRTSTRTFAATSNRLLELTGAMEEHAWTQAPITGLTTPAAGLMSTAKSGWTVYQSRKMGLERIEPVGRASTIYGPSDVAESAFNLVQSQPGECRGYSEKGRMIRVVSAASPASCDDIEVSTQTLPGFERRFIAAVDTDRGTALWQDSGVLSVVDDTGQTTQVIEGLPTALVNAVELTPGKILAATESGDLHLVELDAGTDRVVATSLGRVRALEAVHGTAWLAGDSLLSRVTPARDGVQIREFAPFLGSLAPAGQTIVNVYSLSVEAPDRVLMLGDLVVRGLDGGSSENILLAEVAPGGACGPPSDDVMLCSSNALSDDSLLAKTVQPIAGTGKRLSVGTADLVRRVGGTRVNLALPVRDLVDCSTFMVGTFNAEQVFGLIEN